MKKKLVIIDSYSLIYKCFYGVRPMHSPKGIATNAVYGFVNMLIKIVEEYKPDYFYAAFDEGKKNFRHDKYKEYKAGRQSMPEELREQIPYIEEILSAVGIDKIGVQNYEADDIIGSVSEVADDLGINTIVVTGDKDSFQLVSEHTQILYAKRGISDTVDVDEQYIQDTYGITPKQLIDVKALMGDKSDNIPGVMGVGEKTALNLVSKYGDLDGVYENISEVKGKMKEKIENGKDDAYLSRYLGTIVTDMEIELDLEAGHEFDFGNSKFASILSELDFKALIKRLGLTDKVQSSLSEDGGNNAAVDFEEDFTNYVVINKDSLEDVISTLKTRDSISLYFDMEDENIKGVGIYDGKNFYFAGGDEDLLSTLGEIYKLKAGKYSYNYKEIYKYFLSNKKADYKCDFDIYIGGYVLNPSDERYALEVLAKKYLELDIEENEKEDVQQSFLNLAEDNKDDKIVNTVKNSKCVFLLAELFKQDLKKENMLSLYEDIEHKLIFVLAEMEYLGFKVDTEALEKLGEDFDNRVESLTKEIRDMAGEDESFNVNSTKQLGVVLFEKLGLPVIKKTKTGYSTDVEVLEKLKGAHPIIPLIMELRGISKLNSTYIKGLIALEDKETHRIHSSFNQTVTTTGRISSSNPNLQNIPIRTEEGRVIRKAFIASSEDNVLIDADYSQIELRVLAHISGDEKLIETFERGEDIHTRTASEVFEIPISEITPEFRRRAKAVNFGIIYGISDYGLAKDIGISRQEAGTYIKNYLAKYPGVEKYMTDIVQTAKDKGYVETMFGRRRYIKEIYSKNYNVRSFGERTALNTPIQGSAADIIKIAMINVEKRMKKEQLEAELILQVHDELIIDAPKKEADICKALLKEEMENATKLKCPLKADVSWGYSWYDAK